MFTASQFHNKTIRNKFTKYFVTMNMQSDKANVINGPSVPFLHTCNCFEKFVLSTKSTAYQHYLHDEHEVMLLHDVDEMLDLSSQLQ